MKTEKEPIAIVGMACRLPGGCHDYRQFWDLLCKNSDLISDIDPDRWALEYYYHPNRNSPGKTYALKAGQVNRVFDFDPEFFGISPREAAQMDPQQRLLLEMTWEALEDGGQIPEHLAGSDCSVYIGISSTDYANNRTEDPSVADSYFMTGNTLSIAANRISYLYNLTGPSMAIDTACSSSLVALHQACHSLWSGESHSSIVGSIHLLLCPFPFIGFSKASMLSSDGKCKVFDKDANGFVRSEGGAIFYLKPLSIAEQHNDPIHAVIYATKVNTDGHKSGLTVPNGQMQARLMENIYKEADIHPEQIHYIEAHGTGTPVGDPVETHAIGNIIGLRRQKSNPILIGSVKSNVGHLEPASGVAGMLKVILSIKNRGIPANIHFNEPNPNIDFEALNTKIVDAYTPLNDATGPLIMGVNSFGFGGSNAHVILGEYKQEKVTQTNGSMPDTVPPLYISAQSPSALKDRARQFMELLKHSQNPEHTYNIYYSASFHRQPLRNGLIAWGKTYSEILNQLEQFYETGGARSCLTAERQAAAGNVVFVYSGNSSQWHGMGQGLMNHQFFRQKIEEIDVLFQPLAGWSLVEKLMERDDHKQLDYTEIAQPLLFAVQAGLTHMLRSSGIKPTAVIGHSVGEVAAAWAADILNLENAVKLIYHRSSVQGKTKGQGKMAAAQISEQTVNLIIDEAGNQLELAGINSPKSTTMAGPARIIEEVAGKLKGEGIFCRILDLDYAFHSKAMDPVKSRFFNAIGNIKPKSGTIEYYSTVTGTKLDGLAMDTEYWWKNIRMPVQFRGGIDNLIDQDYRLFVEVGPHPVLQSYIRECMHDKYVTSGNVITTLKRNLPEEEEVRKTIFNLHLLQGLAPKSFFPVPGSFTPLPLYPWDHKEYQFQPTNEAKIKKRDHILLGFRSNNVDGLWQNQIDVYTHNLLAHHVIDNTVVFPAAGYAEMALAASKLTFDRPHHEIANLEIRRPLVINENETRDIQFILNMDDLNFSIKSRPRLSNQSWKINAVGRLINTASDYVKPKINIHEFKQRSLYSVQGTEIYENAALLGLEYGQLFQAVTNVWVGNHELLSLIKLPEQNTENHDHYIAHPVLLDAAFHTLFPAFAERRRQFEVPVTPYLPVAIEDLRFHGRSNEICYCLCRINSHGKQTINATFILMDNSGEPLIELRGCIFRRFYNKSTHNRYPKQFGYRLVPYQLLNEDNGPSLVNTDLIITNLKNKLCGSDIVKEEIQFNTSIRTQYDSLASAIAESVLQQLGAHLEEFTLDSLLMSAGIADKHRPFITYILKVLEQDGKIDSSGTQWKIHSKSSHANLIWQHILQNYPQCVDDMLFTVSRGFNIIQKLTNIEKNRPGTLDVSSHLLHHNTKRLSHQVIRNVIDTVSQNWSFKDHRLKLCFIGYDSISLIKALISTLPANYCDHCIVMDNQEMAALVQSELSKYSNLEIKALDFASNLNEQGQHEAEFDIVIIADTIHKYDHTKFLLSGISHLLKSDGILLVSGKTPDRLQNINYGIDPDWCENGGLTPVARLKQPDKWTDILGLCGFQDIHILTDQILPGAREFVIISRRLKRNTSLLRQPVVNNTARWLIITDGSNEAFETGSILYQKLKALSDNVTLVINNDIHSDPQASPDHDYGHHFFRDNANGNDIKSCNVIYLTGTISPDFNLTGSDIVDLQKAHCITIKNLFNSIEKNLNIAKTKFCIVNINSHGEATSLDENPNPLPENAVKDAVIWGFTRVLRNEYPAITSLLVEIRCTLDHDRLSESIIAEILSPDGEDEIVLTNKGRKVIRLQENVATLSGTSPVVQNFSYQLGFNNPGNLDDLTWFSAKRKKPDHNEVEIEVVAIGLNFRDIMYASGLLPDEMLEGGFAGATLGLECSGIITSVGDGVDEFSVGDSVVTFAPSCFASHVIAPITTVVKKPEQWSFESAATTPAAFFTVFYALSYLGNLKAGEKVLIHGATGGVGLAAIQYAKYCGAEIFATAGTDEKRQFLSLLGVNHIFNSRTLDFADQIMEITNGEGIDVVLNSLAGEAIDKSLSVLRPSGRFLELGKRDYFENTRIGLRQFRHNIAYFGVDVDQLIKLEPELSKHLFKEIMKLFRGGVFTPLVHTVFMADTVTDAFRLMKLSHHVGKIIVTLRNPPSRIVPATTPNVFNANPDGTYIITGGLSGFGFETAKWLAGKQARHLVLIGRRDIQSEKIKQEISVLKANGINVHVKQCDVTDPVALQRILREIKYTLPPVRGIIHSAMVLDDSTIRNLTVENLENVMKPKIQGAWNLHQLTLDLKLDFFIMYSSVATCIGNPGQANYVAANLYLESLALYRRSMGLPALAVAWDAITDKGYLARNTGLRDTLCKKAGIIGITSKQALQTLESLISSKIPHSIVFNPNWEAMWHKLPALKSRKFSWVLHGLSRESGCYKDQNVMLTLSGLTEDKQRAYIATIVAEKASCVLKLPLNHINYDRPLHDMGIDSLMAMELALSIENCFGVEISLMSLADNATINSFSIHIRALIADQITNIATTSDINKDSGVIQLDNTTNKPVQTATADKIILKLN